MQGRQEKRADKQSREKSLEEARRTLKPNAVHVGQTSSASTFAAAALPPAAISASTVAAAAIAPSPFTAAALAAAAVATAALTTPTLSAAALSPRPEPRPEPSAWP